MTDAPSEDFDTQWATFTGSPERQKEMLDILQTMKEGVHRLDIEDGTHAAWHDGKLGVLLVFPREEALSMVNIWDGAHEGNLIALASILDWCQNLISFIEYCKTLNGDFD